MDSSILLDCLCAAREVVESSQDSSYFGFSFVTGKLYPEEIPSSTAIITKLTDGHGETRESHCRAFSKACAARAIPLARLFDLRFSSKAVYDSPHSVMGQRPAMLGWLRVAIVELEDSPCPNT